METFRFYKEHRSDKVWWVEELDESGERKYIGPLLVSFDGKTVVNLWTDYQNLTAEQKELFDKENPFWADFFSDRRL